MIIVNKFKSLPRFYKLQLMATLINGLCAAYSYSVTTVLIYSNVHEEVLSWRMFISSVIGIVFAFGWLQIQEKLFDKFVLMSITEITLYLGICVYAVITYDFDTYLLLMTLLTSFVTSLVVGGISKVHEMITDNLQWRTDYKYFSNMALYVGTLIGALLALFGGMNSTSKFCVVLAFIGLFLAATIENMVCVYIYLQLKKKHGSE